VASHVEDTRKALRSITGRRTNAVKATVALVHATLDVAAAIREQTAENKRQIDVIVGLWHEDT
jgi:hypothetical protein